MRLFNYPQNFNISDLIDANDVRTTEDNLIAVFAVVAVDFVVHRTFNFFSKAFL